MTVLPIGYLALCAVVLITLALALLLREAQIQRQTAHVGRHRPETVFPVGPLYRITYPELYTRYQAQVGA